MLICISTDLEIRDQGQMVVHAQVRILKMTMNNLRKIILETPRAQKSILSYELDLAYIVSNYQGIKSYKIIIAFLQLL